MRRHRPQRNWGARIHETSVYGIDAVVLENATLRVTVLAGKGTDVVECNYKPLDLDFAPLSPGGIRTPRNEAGDPQAAFMESYPGGWQEVLPNGGAPSAHAGASYGQHGEISLVAWDHWIERDDPDGVTVAFEIALRTVPLRLTKRLSLDRTTPTLRFAETLVNESDLEVEAMWGHHIAFGPPFLSGETRVDAPVELGRASSIDYLEGLDSYTIRDDRIGLRVSWDARTMPYLWIWQEHGGTTAYPWWGRLRTVGLEPFSSRPTDGLAEAVRNGTALRLAPREARDFDLTATVLEGTHATDHR
ncbi:DUF4432 family protein [Candidatus Solirubrobacter pratensis]|uniref:DUF4432 family protein n=1 Tax=Candidatus Solirubrobacter pratensis TaxID=1298857 RepID=UPI00041CEC61|nr:DUF4432 family protein [Candidatus Solirubrobacter pratensis]